MAGEPIDSEMALESKDPLLDRYIKEFWGENPADLNEEEMIFMTFAFLGQWRLPFFAQDWESALIRLFSRLVLIVFLLYSTYLGSKYPKFLRDPVMRQTYNKWLFASIIWFVALHAISEIPRSRRNKERYRIWKENDRESAPLIMQKGIMGGYSTFEKYGEVAGERRGIFKEFKARHLDWLTHAFTFITYGIWFTHLLLQVCIEGLGEERPTG